MYTETMDPHRIKFLEMATNTELRMKKHQFETHNNTLVSKTVNAMSSRQISTHNFGCPKTSYQNWPPASNCRDNLKRGISCRKIKMEFLTQTTATRKRHI